MEFILFFIFPPYLIMGFILFSNRIHRNIKIYLLILLDIILILSILLIHYIGSLIAGFALLFLLNMIILTFICTIICLIKLKNKYFLFNIIFIIISLFLFYYDIGNKISLRVELKRAENKIRVIKKYDTLSYDDLYTFPHYKGFAFDSYRSAFVYNDNNLLENRADLIINRSIANFIETEEYNILKKITGGYNIYSIKKIKENWFFCEWQE